MHAGRDARLPVGSQHNRSALRAIHPLTAPSLGEKISDEGRKGVGGFTKSVGCIAGGILSLTFWIAGEERGGSSSLLSSPQGGESAVAKEEGRKEDALWLPPSPLQSSPCLSNCRCMVDCFTPSILFAARRGRKEGGYRGVVVIWVWLLLVGREAVTGGEFSLPEVIQG